MKNQLLNLLEEWSLSFTSPLPPLGVGVWPCAFLFAGLFPFPFSLFPFGVGFCCWFPFGRWVLLPAFSLLPFPLPFRGLGVRGRVLLPAFSLFPFERWVLLLAFWPLLDLGRPFIGWLSFVLPFLVPFAGAFLFALCACLLVVRLFPSPCR